MATIDPSATAADGIQTAESEHRLIKEMLAELQGSRDLNVIRQIVTTLAQTLPDHFDGEEGHDGLYEELRLMQPALSPKLDRLARDHAGLRRELSELQAVVGKIDALFERLCDLKGDFIQHLTKHEASESGLVADAYYIDLGESG